MVRYQRPLLRLATLIWKRLAGPGCFVEARFPAAPLTECERYVRWMEMARQRGWTLATAKCLDQALQAARSLQCEWPALVGRLESAQPNVASVGDLYSDLVSLHDEFDEVRIDWEDTKLSVLTESIQLEQVELGPFEIALDWDTLGGDSPDYLVVARDPYPASSDHSITHPHVQGGEVCEGDGRQPIRRALRQGRLLDFFLIVVNLLRTYNSGDPHVALVDWNRDPCTDCGTLIDPEDRCFKCGGPICHGCEYACPICDAGMCVGCSNACKDCEEHFCDDCSKKCPDCGSVFCESCLVDAERCVNCHDRRTHAQKNVTESDVQRPDEPAVAPV